MNVYYPPGNYRAEVTNQALGETKKTGNPQFVLTFRVLEALDHPSPGMNSYERSIFRVITDNTVEYLLQDLERLGFYGQSFSQLDPETEGFHDFRGKEIEVFCKHEEYEGNSVERWSLSRGGSLEIKPLPAKSRRDLDNKYGKQLKAMFGKSPQSLDAANQKVADEFERDTSAAAIDATIAKGREATANAALADAATSGIDCPF